MFYELKICQHYIFTSEKNCGIMCLYWEWALFESKLLTAKSILTKIAYKISTKTLCFAKTKLKIYNKPIAPILKLSKVKNEKEIFTENSRFDVRDAACVWCLCA